MSYDLHIFDVEHLPDSVEEIGDLLEDQSQWNRPLTERLSAFVDVLEELYPVIDDDPSTYVWSVWPLREGGASSMGGNCLTLSVVWSAASRVVPNLVTMALGRGFTVFDGQADGVRRPS